jgi:hypothetical protein
MMATRTPFCESGGASDRAIPRIPHFVAEYIGPAAEGCQDAVLTFRRQATEQTREPTHRAQHDDGFQCIIRFSTKFQKVDGQVYG